MKLAFGLNFNFYLILVSFICGWVHIYTHAKKKGWKRLCLVLLFYVIKTKWWIYVCFLLHPSKIIFTETKVHVVSFSSLYCSLIISSYCTGDRCKVTCSKSDTETHLQANTSHQKFRWNQNSMRSYFGWNSKYRRQAFQ